MRPRLHRLAVVGLLTDLVLFASAVDPFQRRQASRVSVVARQLLKERMLRPRASIVPCAPGEVETVNVACCPTDDTYYPGCNGGGPISCCEGGVIYSADQYEISCCDGGLYSPPGTGYQGCCYDATKITGDQTICCAPDENPVFDACIPASRKRDMNEATAKKILKRRVGSDRFLLGPEQVAEYFVNNGRFNYDGATYVDYLHRQTNEKMLNRLLGKGLMAAMRYVSPTEKGVADVIDTMKYYPLSSSYEFALEDAPDIYARIVSDPSFTHFHWQGASFDRQVLHRLVSPHPSYNETLIAHYAEQYK